MGIVRNTAASSSGRSPADPGPPRKRPGNGLPADGLAVKNFRQDVNQTEIEIARQPDTSTSAVTVAALQSAEILPIRPLLKTLDRYRLKAPASLPVANARGLRVIKGRSYVDIAPGEIVLVRQNTISGEYRASLTSELVASGPVLFFDSQSRTWTPEPAADSATVMPDNTDQRIRDTSYDSSRNRRVNTGLDDWFERETALGTTLVARGLKQFPPEQAALIRAELRVTESVFADAARAIGLKYQDADALYECFFGADHQTVVQRFSDSVTRGLALSREYQGFWGEEKFLGVDADDNRGAWMYRNDFHGRFFLNHKYMKHGILSMSLGHEMLHTNRIDRFKTIGPGAVDFFYLNGSLRGCLKSGSHGVYDIAERGVSEVIMRGGLTVDYLNAFSDDHDALLFGISDYLGIGDDLELPEAVDLFNANPSLRAHLAANNADSIVYAAKSMQQLHRSKTDYAWLDSLIND